MTDKLQTALDALPKHDDNPYGRARFEFQERYGELVQGRIHWRRQAIAAWAIAALAVAGIVVIGAQAKVEPYVVEVDRLGRVMAVGHVQGGAVADAQVIRTELADFIANTRSVYVDAAAQRRIIDRAFSRVPRETAAHRFLTEFYRGADPFERAKTGTVTVEVESVLPLAGDTWRVEWSETERDRSGGVQASENYQAAITVKRSPPRDEAAIVANPFGLYFPELTWTKRQ